jgi:hypothetical protein
MLTSIYERGLLLFPLHNESTREEKVSMNRRFSVARCVFALTFPLCVLTTSASTRAAETKAAAQNSTSAAKTAKEGMSYLKNSLVRLGVDLGQGGAITYLSKATDEVDLVNSFDRGRQIQMSDYSGPVLFEPNGKKPQPY